MIAPIHSRISRVLIWMTQHEERFVGEHVPKEMDNVYILFCPGLCSFSSRHCKGEVEGYEEGIEALRGEPQGYQDFEALAPCTSFWAIPVYQKFTCHYLIL